MIRDSLSIRLQQVKSRTMNRSLRRTRPRPCAPRCCPDSRAALLDRGWSETELEGFPGESLLQALDLARAPP